jgi:hypothetical protein
MRAQKKPQGSTAQPEGEKPKGTMAAAEHTREMISQAEVVYLGPGEAAPRCRHGVSPWDH